MQGTEFILRSLVADGVDHLFLVPGGLVDPFYPSLGAVPELRPIVAAQEGGAAYMADGYARASGGFGAALVIGGPGLTNAATAVSTAYTDRVPLLVLSGEVATQVEGLGFFQDASAGTFDDTAMLAGVTRQSYSVPDVGLLHHRYRGALKRMFDHVPGPVHLSLPRDVQTGDLDLEPAPVHQDLLRGRPLDGRAVRRALDDLLTPDGGAPARRIVLLVGREVADDGDAEVLAQVAERYHLPVATTQHGKGVLAEDHELSLGVFGYAGTRHATAALLDERPDLVIVLGAAFDQRDSMHWTSAMAPRLGVLAVAGSPVHVACESDDVRYVAGHPGAFLELLADDGDHAAALAAGVDERRRALAEVRSGPRYYDEATRTSDQDPIHPARLVTELRAALPRETIALPDSGAHRAFLVHHWDSLGPRRFITAAELGPMGWAIAAGVGVQAARPDERVLVLTGDGCMQMHGMEIQTAARFDLPVIYVVDNNGALGNVWLRAHTEGPVPDALTRTVDHDWAGFARALGVAAETVRTPEELAPAIARARDAGTTYLLDVKTERDAPTPVEPYRQAAAAWSFHE